MKAHSPGGIVQTNRMRRHLAIFSPEAIEALLAGKKLVETRFSQRRIEPFAKVSIGDVVYIKPPGKEIVGQFKVKKVISFEGMEKEDWQLIKLKFGRQTFLGSKQRDGDFFKKHQNAHFGTLIFIDQTEQFITSPVKINKKDLRGWMVLPMQRLTNTR